MNTAPAIRYFWSRVSLVLLAFFLLYQVLVVLKGVFYGVDVTFWFLLAGGFFVLGFIYSMRVVVDKESLYISYGIGLFSKDINLAEIERCSIVENKNLLAWVYNPGGQYALRLHFRMKRDVTIPSDDPKKLQGILLHRI
jgi:hypothetical protein